MRRLAATTHAPHVHKQLQFLQLRPSLLLLPLLLPLLLLPLVLLLPLLLRSGCIVRARS
jgi:hypothetical protein